MDIKPNRFDKAPVAHEYRERLVSVLGDPIDVNLADYSRGRPYAPTPLDPDAVFVQGINVETGIMSSEVPETYRNHAHRMALGEALRVSSCVDLPQWFSERLEKELTAQVENRCDHNNESLLRLVQAINERGVHDEDMLEIIRKARMGMADLPELLRLIKEFPEMGSVEVSSYRRLHNRAEMDAAIKAAHDSANDLQSHFSDAVVTVVPKAALSLSDSTTVQGVKVVKQALARAESQDSATELVAKITMMLTPQEGFVPVGVTTYLRAVDAAHEQIAQYED